MWLFITLLLLEGEFSDGFGVWCREGGFAEVSARCLVFSFLMLLFLEELWDLVENFSSHICILEIWICRWIVGCSLKYVVASKFLPRHVTLTPFPDILYAECNLY
jgi:hypothetical protein